MEHLNPAPNTNLLGLKIPGKFTLQKDVKFKESIHTYDMSITYDVGFNAYLSFLESQPAALGATHTGNYEYFNRSVYSDDGGLEWKGGSYNDLIDPITDYSGYQQAKKEIQDNKLFKKIAYSFDQSMVRRRTRCEYDGELDLDKKWDAQPFQRRSKKNQTIRMVKLFVDAGFSSVVSSKTVNDYGCFVSALINVLEKNGIQVEINLRYTGYDFYESPGSKIYLYTIKIKRADEYLPIGMILKAFSTVWMRRAFFSLIVCGAEFCGHKVRDNFGTPYQHGTSWEIKGNELHIYSVPDHNQQNNIVAELLKIVGKDI